MLFLAISTNTRDVSELVGAEFERVDQLRAGGVIKGGWLKSDFSGAVLLLECTNNDEAVTVLNSLPTAAHGATIFDIIDVVELDSARA